MKKTTKQHRTLQKCRKIRKRKDRNNVSTKKQYPEDFVCVEGQFLKQTQSKHSFKVDQSTLTVSQRPLVTPQ